jgi:RTA1 like protein
LLLQHFQARSTIRHEPTGRADKSDQSKRKYRPFACALISASYNYYGYNPSLAAAIIFSIAFGVTTIIGVSNLLRHIKHVKGRFLYVFLFCPFCKMIGYILRSIGATEPTVFNLYISSQFFIYMTPQICAAAGYLTYAGLVFFVDGKFSLIRHKNVAIIFLGSDIISSSIQGAGCVPLMTRLMLGAGQLFGANANTWKIGAGLCLGGMILEFLAFTTFSLVVLHFGHRYRRNKQTIPEADERIPVVDRILIALYINMAGQFVCACIPQKLILGSRCLPLSGVRSVSGRNFPSSGGVYLRFRCASHSRMHAWLQYHPSLGA